MKFSQLRDLIAVAQQGGLRRAARHLGVAQPGVSRSIRDLEHELGATLFERTTTGMVLTPAGEAFCRRGVAIQHELQRACDEVRQLTGVARGVVSVALSTAAHVAMLPATLKPFFRRYPGVQLQFTEAVFPEIEANLRDGSIDFFVGAVWKQDLSTELSSEKLFDNRSIVMGRKDGPFVGARSLHDLANAKWIISSAASNAATMQPIFSGFGLPPPDIAVRARTSMSMIMVAGSSDLLMMVPQQWLGFAHTFSQIEHISLREDLPGPSICIVTKSSLPLTPAAEHLADLFRRAALHRTSETIKELEMSQA